MRVKYTILSYILRKIFVIIEEKRSFSAMYDIKNLTLEEKMRLVTGKNNWQLSTANGKLPQVFLADGPHGLRKVSVEKLEQGVSETEATYRTTAMPNICVLSNTWSVETAYLQGSTIADDCLECGADILLAPGVNIKRTPLCGRNFEYFSEDPYLAGHMAKAFVLGVQDKGIGATVKHFCCNNREYDRWNRNSEVDERTLREIYTPAFEIVFEAKPWAVMCSYNPVNGVYASENKNFWTGCYAKRLVSTGWLCPTGGRCNRARKRLKILWIWKCPTPSVRIRKSSKAMTTGILPKRIWTEPF